jgi:hypothetical protein
MNEYIDIMEDDDAIRDKLEDLRREHRDIDEEINNMGRGGAPVDFILMQRLKKRKLAIKDMVNRLESLLLPDIIA